MTLAEALNILGATSSSDDEDFEDSQDRSRDSEFSCEPNMNLS